MKHTFSHRLLPVFLALSFVFCSFSALVLHAGAGDTPIIPMEPSHQHAYSETIIEEPTCTEVGLAQYACSCGATFQLNVPARGHEYQEDEPYCLNGCGQINASCQAEHHHRYMQPVILQQPTCEKQGVTTQTCFLCGNTFAAPTDPLGHVVCESIVTKPTASALGYTTHTCARCGNSYVDTYTPATAKPTLSCKKRAMQTQTLSWNNIKTATGYQLQITTKDGKKWEKTVTLKAGTTSYTFKGLEAGKPYRFRVRFYIKAADGNNYFAPWSATLRSPTLPKGTSVSKVTGAKKAFTAQWKQNKEITGYQLQYSLKSNFSAAKAVTIKSNKTIKTTVKKLTAKKNYYVRIRTYTTVDKANYYSSWSKAVKVKTK